MAATIGWSAPLEQLGPAEALAGAELSEAHGFSGVMAADHFAPWVPAQGQSPFVWSVLAALGQRTAGDLGPGVASASFRFHPAIIAQAAATQESLYPGRTWLGLGAGEALNEHVVAPYWPEAGVRSAMLFEAVDVIKKLFAASLAGKDVKHSGAHYRMETTRLWTMPVVPPPVLVATAGPINAKKTGMHADGIITPAAPREKLEMLLERFAAGAREAGKDPGAMPKVLQVHCSWAPTDEGAAASALTQWPNGGMAFPKGDIRSPHDFAAMARLVRAEDFAGRMLISSDPDAHRAQLQGYLDLGFDRVYVHNVAREQGPWMEVFGREVLPALVR